jgi:NAD dependent epimerase/dehydratase family enzyme
VERASILIDSQRVSSKKILELGYDFAYKEVDEALNNLYNRDDNLT